MKNCAGERAHTATAENAAEDSISYLKPQLFAVSSTAHMIAALKEEGVNPHTPA